MVAHLLSVRIPYVAPDQVFGAGVLAFVVAKLYQIGFAAVGQLDVGGFHNDVQRLNPEVVHERRAPAIDVADPSVEVFVQFNDGPVMR